MIGYRAIEEFPQLNDGFEVIEKQPSRVRRESLNLGIAIDLEKKDGTRTLLVPNLKNATQLYANYSSSKEIQRAARQNRLVTVNIRQSFRFVEKS